MLKEQTTVSGSNSAKKYTHSFCQVTTVKCTCPLSGTIHQGHCSMLSIVCWKSTIIHWMLYDSHCNSIKTSLHSLDLKPPRPRPRPPEKSRNKSFTYIIMFLGVLQPHQTRKSTTAYSLGMLFLFECHAMPSVLRRCCLGSRKGIRPVKTEWWDAGMVICLEHLCIWPS